MCSSQPIRRRNATPIPLQIMIVTPERSGIAVAAFTQRVTGFGGLRLSCSMAARSSAIRLFLGSFIDLLSRLALQLPVHNLPWEPSHMATADSTTYEYLQRYFQTNL